MIKRRKLKKYLLVVLLIMAFIPVIITAWEVVFAKDNSVVFLGNYHPKVVFLVIFYYILLMVLGFFWFTRQLILVSRLKIEQEKTELMRLKSQVNPHFFFNMLNNLYGLVEHDAPRARELILRLSDLMRYSIHEGEKETVALKEEAEYLSNYIRLHQMRYHKNIRVRFHKEVDGEIEVMPLLFIILLENAFKHGVENLRENAFVNLSLESSQNEIQFSVENNFDISNNEEHSGTGLRNLRRRLQLAYPGKHALSVSVTNNIYKARLILKTG